MSEAILLVTSMFQVSLIPRHRYMYDKRCETCMDACMQALDKRKNKHAIVIVVVVVNGAWETSAPLRDRPQLTNYFVVLTTAREPVT